MAAKTLLRIVTTGSVDDGKSTLIGRLLFETRTLFEDQLEAARRTSARRGLEETDLSLLLDGLAAEREQGITIDVAHRYFETTTRKFVLADAPGHVQYTRNMVTGASTADGAILLIDARHGMQTQSRRHAFLASLLGVPQMIVAVNKMDLVGYRREVFEAIREAYLTFAERLDLRGITFLPVSALRGDNVTVPSEAMPWFDGPTLLHHLETLPVVQGRNRVDLRFPVQLVLRPHQDHRGYAGRVASGSLRVGEEVVALPSRATTRVTSIHLGDRPLEEAVAGQSVALTLADAVDLSRGDMLVRRHNLPVLTSRFEATLCWMDEAPLELGRSYLLRQGTSTTRATVTALYHALDVDTLHRTPASTLAMNEIGKVQLLASRELHLDPYRVNRATGSFILVDPLTHATAAAGLVLGSSTTLEGQEDRGLQPRSPHTVWTPWNIPREAREQRQGHEARVLWFTGLSGSGKSTLARALEERLFTRGLRTMLLDGDQVRHGLCRDLGFTPLDRRENIRRVGEVARLFFEAGHVVLCTFISPYAADRSAVRALFPEGRFLEVHVACDLVTCQARDPHGLYRKAAAGEIPEFTGITAPYEPPEAPELTLDTGALSVDQALERLLGWF